jgi:HlyD family secretion protein
MSTTGSKVKKLVAFIVVIVLIVGGCVWYYLQHRDTDKRVKASGTVEVTEVQLAPLAGGRIIELNIKEADVVKKGQLIARMSLDGADRDVAMAQEALAAAQQQYSEMQTGFRKEDIAKARAEVSLRATQYNQAVRDQKRFEGLAKEGVVAKRDAELYTEAANAKRDAMTAANEQLRLLLNGMRPEEIAAAKANMKRAEAAVAKAKTLVGYKNFYSPSDGTILTKNYELGDVVSPGAPIATLGQMNDCWIKLYIPSTQLGLVKLGGKAEVVVDAYPGRKLPAKITEVNQQAEYNPRLSLTQKERSNMVFWIKVSVDNKDGILKPGMPADVTLD